MRRRKLKKLWNRLCELQKIKLTTKALLIKNGEAKKLSSCHSAPALARLGIRMTPRAVLEKFSAMRMIDVHLPTSDGRTIILSSYTQLETDLSAPS